MIDVLKKHSVNEVLASAFEQAGFALFLVGGSVRDALAGTPDFSDLDYTTPARPDQILSIVEPLGPTWTIGEEFGTICVQVQGVKVEVTTYRTEAYEPGSRKPVVAFGETIADDLKRRDLTINALALCLVGDGEYVPGDLVDLFGGAEALAQGTLVTPDDPEKTVSEDPLRQLRAIRFAVKRGMTIAPSLVEAIRANAHRLSIVAVERRCDELRKVLDAGPAATLQASRLAGSLGVEGFLFGDLDAGAAHSTLENLEGGDRVTVLAALVESTFEVLGDAEAAMKGLKLSNEEIKPALAAARALRKIPSDGNLVDTRRLVRGNDEETLDRALVLANAAGTPGHLLEMLQAVRAEPGVRSALPVDGNDLLAAGLKGPAVGAALQAVTEAFLSNPSLTRDEAMALAAS